MYANLYFFIFSLILLYCNNINQAYADTIRSHSEAEAPSIELHMSSISDMINRDKQALEKKKSTNNTLDKNQIDKQKEINPEIIKNNIETEKDIISTPPKSYKYFRILSNKLKKITKYKNDDKTSVQKVLVSDIDASDNTKSSQKSLFQKDSKNKPRTNKNVISTHNKNNIVKQDESISKPIAELRTIIINDHKIKSNDQNEKQNNATLPDDITNTEKNIKKTNSQKTKNLQQQNNSKNSQTISNNKIHISKLEEEYKEISKDFSALEDENGKMFFTIEEDDTVVLIESK